jgi:hypothetical protein
MRDPAFLFYFVDFAYGTRKMTFEEKGCYIELICEQADSGHLTIEDIKRTLKNSFPIWESIRCKYDMDNDGKFYNKILDEHIEKRRKYTESRKNNLNSPHKDAHINSDMENKDINTNRIEIVINSWNAFAEMKNLPKFTKLTDKRESHLTKRINEKEFNFDNILEHIEKSDFLLGLKTEWKVDLDFIIKNSDNYLKILEGKYNNGTNKIGNGASPIDLATITANRFKRQQK